MGIDKNEWGFRVGHLPHGERNKISDVPGVTVGHCTLADGDIQTGVTALLPHPGDVFHDKVLAACMSSTASARPPALSKSMSWVHWRPPSCLPTP